MNYWKSQRLQNRQRNWSHHWSLFDGRS